MMKAEPFDYQFRLNKVARDQIRIWSQEYNITHSYSIEWDSFMHFPSPKRMAQTTYEAMMYDYDLNPPKWIYKPHISFSTRWIDQPQRFTEKMFIAILWHEFCHAESYMEDLEFNAPCHDRRWKELRRRKPIMIFYEWLAKLVW